VGEGVEIKKPSGEFYTEMNSKLRDLTKLISCIIFYLLLLGCTKETFQTEVEFKERISGIRLAWDYSSIKKLAPGTGRINAYYGRLIQMSNKQLICIYEIDGDIEVISSSDSGQSWGTPVIVSAKENGVARSVPEIIELQNKTLLASYNLRPSSSNQDPLKKFAIAVKISSDGGLTWSNENIVYTADYLYSNGCWEPSQIQLPSGEIQLFFSNENPYRESDEQEISMMRSYDNGKTWTPSVKVIFRAGKRDGMPVPLLLNDKQTILVSIEDNGYSTEFKPSIIKSDVVINWSNTPVSGSSSDRYQPLKDLIDPLVYAGAPYLRQLSTNEIILSYQATDNRQSVWDLSSMRVSISDDNGNTFHKITVPFNIPLTSRGLWNSLATVNDCIWALTSTNAYNTSDRSEIFSIKSRTIPSLTLMQRDIIIDGILDNSEYGQQLPIYIGQKGDANVNLGVAEDNDNLCIAALVTDSEVVTDDHDIKNKDGITIYIDANNNLAPNIIQTMVYSLTFSADSDVLFEEGNYGIWGKRDIIGLTYVVRKTDTGYIIEMQMPISDLKSITSKQVWGLNVSLNNKSENHNFSYKETISGADENNPSTWCPLTIIR
jgi:hypothetical protein